MSGLPPATQDYACLIETLAAALNRITALEAENSRLVAMLAEQQGGNADPAEDDTPAGPEDSLLQASPSSLQSLRF